MYIPAEFQLTDQAEAVAFMQRYSFATLVSVEQGVPVASHLPFSVTSDGSRVCLTAHLARANSQWRSWGEQEVMVLFTGPHAYISPTLYQQRESVPTWDYVAVHAYGRVRLLEDATATEQVLQQLIAIHEPAYQGQWDTLPEKYKAGLRRALVAFEVEVTTLQGQKKLSQSRSAVERAAIMEHLASSDDSIVRDLAPYMQNG
ncbi:FMN-binding negative transcriptional regulator [Hymenobacter sp. GOD-10R]|uniref:FMN-binding negative transcriptional regulator n=1 Tax=Hymenobacter sp. GOD-10R TaxID=3093922 RepID=UPI002D79524C|nr:FMN-binding negative transcriptional regulator [Hymenobacter sp. GOD-10R]WRQ31251.1 FMN-binding negative transcriptional regulator [Hymenobacter sp. GOD-10R]